MRRSKERFAREQSVSPSMRAAYEVEPSTSGGCRVSFRITGLAEPPPGIRYVVWAEPRNGAPIRLGDLVLQDNGCGHLIGAPALDRFRLTVTLEDGDAGPLPSEAVVYRTDTLPPFRPLAWYGAAARAR